MLHSEVKLFTYVSSMYPIIEDRQTDTTTKIHKLSDSLCIEQAIT